MLSLLLATRDEDGQPLTDTLLRDELMAMLLAGHEITATALAFAFDLLLHNPQTLTRLADECPTPPTPTSTPSSQRGCACAP